MTTENHQETEQSAPTTPSVVVGVDGSTGSGSAAAWAAYEAHSLAAPLELVHVVDEAFEHSPYFSVEILDKNAQRIVEEACDEVAKLSLPITVRSACVFGRPSRTLREAAAHAQMLVLGRRGHGQFASLLLGSVSAGTASHATVPTVVVPKEWDSRQHTARPVVVGIDGSPASDSALRYAVEFADRHGAALRVVHAWGHETYFAFDAELLRDSFTLWRAEAAASISSALDPWRRKFPRLQIETAFHQSSVIGALARESEHAQAVVVGGHVASRLHAALAGSVTYGILMHAASPIIVVPEGH